MSPSLHTRGDLTGRVLGILAFLLGVGLLCVVFNMAYTLFHASPTGRPSRYKPTGNPKTDPSLSAIGTQFGGLLYKLASAFYNVHCGSTCCAVRRKAILQRHEGPHAGCSLPPHYEPRTNAAVAVMPHKQRCCHERYPMPLKFDARFPNAVYFGSLVARKDSLMHQVPGPTNRPIVY